MMAAPDRRAKRCFDLVVAAAALAVLWPVMAVIAVLIRATSPGPALHRAVRVGRDGKEFTLYKFRSMRVSSAAGARITAGGDTRITPIGRLLRRSKFDELPQLFNVVRGEMSLVGPRPEDPHYVARYSEAERRILAYRPGLTSPASVEYRHEETVLGRAENLETAYAQIAAAKIEIDLRYFPRQTLVGDLRIIARTLRAVLQRSE